MKNVRYLIVTLFLITILFVSFEANCASAVLKNIDPAQKLPYILLRWAEYISKGNATKLSLILDEIVQQEARNQETIKASNGAVLHPSMPKDAININRARIQPDYVGYYWINDITGTSDIKYDYSTWDVVGEIDDATNLVGGPDDYYANLLTCGWDQVDPDLGGGEALASCTLDGTCQSGQIYIQAEVGPRYDSGLDLYDGYGWYEWQNWVIVCVSDGPVGMGDATYVGCVSVQDTSKTQYFVGYAGEGGPFNYIYVFCWTPPWYPNDYYPHIYNSVLIDTAFAWGSNP